MKNTQNLWIKLKNSIDQEDYDLINNLQRQCIKEDKTTLKLELDYKVAVTHDNEVKANIEKVNEFMYFQEQTLIGYIGICSFGELGTSIEVNGMVHPDYRGQGVFTKLFELAISEWKRRNTENILLLCDRNSSSGQSFIQETEGKYKHSEYEMYLNKKIFENIKRGETKLFFRKAINEDALEISRQNAIYFNNGLEEANNTEIIKPIEGMIMPEEEEKRGMKIYIAEKDGIIIGKVHNQLNNGIGGIYGLGVLPQHRGKGFGREILIMSVEKLMEENADEIMLQVESKNGNALNLYKSCGFEETSTMDYYEIKR